MSGSVAARGGSAPCLDRLDRALAYLGPNIPITATALEETFAAQFETAISALLGKTLGAVGSITGFVINGVIAFFVLAEHERASELECN